MSPTGDANLISDYAYATPYWNNSLTRLWRGSGAGIAAVENDSRVIRNKAKIRATVENRTCPG